MIHQVDMQIAIAMMIWPEVPHEGLIFSPAENYKVIGFKGIATPCSKFSRQPVVAEEAAKVFLWIKMGRPSV
jgi:hypothetical protein